MTTRSSPAHSQPAPNEYIVSRDRDLLPLGIYVGITIIAPEPFLRIVRGP
jgi:hypothetical protein